MVYFAHHHKPDDYSRLESEYLTSSANRAVFLADDALCDQDEAVNRSRIKDDRLLRDINSRMAATAPRVTVTRSYRSRSVGRAPSVPPSAVSYRSSSVARRRAKSVEPLPISVDYSLRAHRRPAVDVSFSSDRSYLDRAYAAAEGIADSTRGMDWDLHTGRHSLIAPGFVPYGSTGYYSSVSRTRRASSVPPMPLYSGSVYSSSARSLYGAGRDRHERDTASDYAYPSSLYPSLRSLVGPLSSYSSYRPAVSVYGGGFGSRYSREAPSSSSSIRFKVDLSGRGSDHDARPYQPWRHSLVTSSPKRSPLHIECDDLTVNETPFRCFRGWASTMVSLGKMKRGLRVHLRNFNE